MIYDVYGNYIEGMEDDFWDIVNYFGKDFIEAKKRPLLFHYNSLGESYGESQGPDQHNQLILLNKYWRRGRDSNPRYVAVHLISSQAPSTTRTPLLAG